MADFHSAVADFVRFAVQHGYPSTVLWTSADFVLFWRRRFFILVVDPEKHRLQAKASFDAATARSIGVAIEGKCKTKTTTICRVYVPFDDTDAQYRLIPATGVKFSVANNPITTILVRNRLLWWVLKRLSEGPSALWD